jgi:hypothetical protein
MSFCAPKTELELELAKAEAEAAALITSISQNPQISQ